MKPRNKHIIRPHIPCFIILLCLSLNAQTPLSQWDFLPEKDDFTANALLDLRYLNESFAGENGFIELSDDGESFVDQKGNPIRFWAVGGGDRSRRMSDDELAYFARFLAKKGVNMIRFHGRIHSVTNDINEANKEEIKAIWRLVDAMKKEGIYTTISPFWSHFLEDIPDSWHLGEYTGGKHRTYALLYFNPHFQQAYKNWIIQLYTTVNPATGIALKDEPAVGVIQLLNEDGVFFWTIDRVQPSLRKLMEHQFHKFLIGKYGSLEKVYRYWGANSKLPKDRPLDSQMELYPIWMATQDELEANRLRLKDQLEFYYTAQAKFYQETYGHLRAIGCRQLINGTNWKTANDAKLLDLERYTQIGMDILAVNRYYSAGHEGPNRGWRVQQGDRYIGRSVLFHPEKLPVNVKQVKGKPFIMTESSWPLPHKYLAEATFLTSAYASMSGFDMYYWYSPGSHGYANEKETFHTFDDTYSKGNYPIYKFNISNPGYLSTFPANALLFRKGYVQEGASVSVQNSSLDDLLSLKSELPSENSGFDPNRDEGITDKTDNINLVNLAFLAGKVSIDFVDKKKESLVAQKALDSLIDLKTGRITSITDEIIWDYQEGYCTLNTPKAKGVTGFLNKKDSFGLDALTISTRNPYGSILAVSLDDRPLRSSRSILVQVNTQYETTGYQEKPVSWTKDGETKKGFEIVKTGDLPWKATSTDLKIGLKNPYLKSAIALDLNGYRKKVHSLERVGAQVSFTLPKDCLYLILTDNSL